jgi:hypothetical protein
MINGIQDLLEKDIRTTLIVDTIEKLLVVAPILKLAHIIGVDLEGECE